MTQRSPERSSARKLGGKAPKAKRKTNAKTRHPSGPSAADLRRELSRRTVELAEAREQQAATAEVLQVISSSRGELGPVFDAMLANAMRICAAQCGFIYKMEAGAMRAMAEIGVPPALAEYRRQHLHTGGATTPVDLMRVTKKPAHVPDARESDAYRMGNPNAVAGVELGGARTVLYVPMIRDENIVGVINLYRQEVRPFTTEQIALLENFASQAVIAIENAHLFEEVQRQTRDLTESLQQQTATAEVLSVISGSLGDLAPVFNAMLGKAMDLCAADFGVLNTFDGELFHTAATRGLPPVYDEYRRSQPLEYGPGTAPARLLQGEPIVEIPDLRESDAYRRGEPNRRALVDLGGARSILAVPLLKNDQVVGNVMIFRQEPARFSEKQISLLKQFAAQAVIAIENTRLLRELRASSEDLRESLQQQTATADVLKVISRSAFDLNAVFQTVAESSVRLCGADRAFIFRFDGELLRMAVAFNSSPEFTEWVAQHPIRPGQHSGSARAALERRTIHIPDVLSDPNYSYGAKDVETIRTVLGVPILKGDDLLGVMMIYHLEVRPFTDKQIALVETFADQAAIAIENVRLFDEVNARTEDLRESLQQQTATADVLKVISRSAFDLQTVLDTLVESAARLCEADMAAITRQKGDEYFRAGSYGFTPEFMDYVKDIPVKPERATITGRTLLEGTVIHVPDVLADPDYTFSEAQKLSGNPRTFLGVPLLREGNPVGALVLLRRTMRPFTDKQVELVTTFADQAVIAIENVRLFDEVQARTKELAASLDDLRTAQDRLVQTEKLASLGQLTAGIAHEIKNPLNFVNNFSALSAELIGELSGVLKPVALDNNVREEVDELTGMLKSNLEKVVQHGKRADSIVKNMLQHSREGSGEHRPADINAIVDESLNLAYHGARAEKAGFSIVLQRDLDPAVGMADIYPQEITRVLLNLISNSFYATTKRKAEAGDGFEPMVSAATKNLGDKVEIRVRDNGTGIPEEAREKIFNPFFTTKPSGEGTGLGLSMSHDIVVKQHGGSIDVETEPGVFTEFRIVLPRTSQR